MSGENEDEAAVLVAGAAVLVGAAVVAGAAVAVEDGHNIRERCNCNAHIPSHDRETDLDRQLQEARLDLIPAGLWPGLCQASVWPSCCQPVLQASN